MGARSSRPRSTSDRGDASHTDYEPSPVVPGPACLCASPHREPTSSPDAEAYPAQVVEPPNRGSGPLGGSSESEPEAVERGEAARPPLRLVLVDDSPLFLGTLQRLLETLNDVRVIGSATSGREVLELLDRIHPDLLLMDLVMPDLDGLQVSRMLANRPERPWIVIMSIHDLPAYRKEARMAGADGFITKADLVNQLEPLMRHLLDRSDEGSPGPS